MKGYKVNNSSTTSQKDPFRPPPSSKEELDQALGQVSRHRQEWVALPILERIELLEQARRDFREVWERWSQYSVAAKGISDRELGNDWEWLEIATINRLHTMILNSLLSIRDGQKPRVKGGYRRLSNGQVAARVYPDTLTHSLAFRNFSMDVWLEPGVTLEEARAKQASQYFDSNREGRLALVLGAGNASSLPTSDVFHKLFIDLRTVILKMNPVNSYLGPLMEEGYRALIDRGFLNIVYGGAEEGHYLVHHDQVDEVHMTGSDRTFDAIVFGSGDEGLRRKAAGSPIVDKPVEGELGCITPWIIVPGAWSEKRVEHEAARMAFWMMRHEGYLCFAPRILVLHRSWPHRQRFLDALQRTLSKVAPIQAYYPGSAETQKLFVMAHAQAIEIGGELEDHVPWTVIPDLDPSVEDDICFRRESFSGLCGEVTLDAPTVPEFLEQAVEFLNHTVWGTLSATMVVSEKSLSDPMIGAAVERTIEDLRYGTVALNGPGTFGFYSGIAPWGGYPGSPIEDIQSGTCRVMNALMLHRPQKTVVRAPFTWWPYPFFPTANRLDHFARRLAEFEKDMSLLRLPGMFWSAVRT